MSKGSERCSAKHTENAWAGLAAGLAAGLTASWVMNRYRGLWGRLSRNGHSHGDSGSAGENPTVETASAISKVLLNEELPERQQTAAGSAVHYIFGTAIGGAYGVATELAPREPRGGDSLRRGHMAWRG